MRSVSSISRHKGARRRPREREKRFEFFFFFRPIRFRSRRVFSFSSYSFPILRSESFHSSADYRGRYRLHAVCRRRSQFLFFLQYFDSFLNSSKLSSFPLRSFRHGRVSLASHAFTVKLPRTYHLSEKRLRCQVEVATRSKGEWSRGLCRRTRRGLSIIRCYYGR